MADGGGFFSGYIEGQQADMQNQLSKMALAEGQQKLELGRMEIQRTQTMLKQQEEYIRRMQELNQSGHTAPGGSGPGGNTPQDQARYMAGHFWDASEVASQVGMGEQARADAETASKLDINASLIDEHSASTNKTKAEFGANAMHWALEAPNDQEFMRRYTHSVMAYQSTFGEQSPFADFKQHPPSRERAEAIYKATQTAVQEAEISEKKAQERRAYAEARKFDADTATRKTLLPAQLERAKQLAKSGGTTKAQQKQVDSLQDVISDVDDLITQMDAHPDMSLTGLKGRARSLMESASGLLGGGEEGSPEHEFQTTIAAIRSKLPRAMTGASRSSKEERDLTSTLADLTAPGVTGKIGKERAQKLKNLLQAQLDKSAVRPSGESGVVTLEDYLAAHPSAEE